MDLALYARVLWRFRGIVAAGFVIAVALAFLTVEKVGFSGGLQLSPRKAQVWKSDAFIQVTGKNFPAGRVVPAYTSGNASRPAVDVNDPARLSYLTTLYANLATNDAVIHSLGINPKKPQDGTLTVTAVPGPAYSNPAILNILDFSATGPSPARAKALASGGALAFQDWLRRNQDANDIPPNARAIAPIYKSATPAVVISHGGKTLPVIVFLTIMGATFGLALVLENLRPQPVAAKPSELHAEGGSAGDAGAEQKRKTA